MEVFSVEPLLCGFQCFRFCAVKTGTLRVFSSSHFSKCQGAAVHHLHCFSAFMLENMTVLFGGGTDAAHCWAKGCVCLCSDRMTTE